MIFKLKLFFMILISLRWNLPTIRRAAINARIFYLKLQQIDVQALSLLKSYFALQMQQMKRAKGAGLVKLL